GLITGSKPGAGGRRAGALLGGSVKPRGDAGGLARRCGRGCVPPNGGIGADGGRCGVLIVVGRRVSLRERAELASARTAETSTLNATSAPIRIGTRFLGSDPPRPSALLSMLSSGPPATTRRKMIQPIRLPQFVRRFGLFCMCFPLNSCIF